MQSRMLRRRVVFRRRRGSGLNGRIILGNHVAEHLEGLLAVLLIPVQVLEPHADGVAQPKRLRLGQKRFVLADHFRWLATDVILDGADGHYAGCLRVKAKLRHPLRQDNVAAHRLEVLTSGRPRSTGTTGTTWATRASRAASRLS